MRKNFYEEHIIHRTAGLPFGIYSVNSGTIPLHYHREFEFLAVTRGTAKIQLENKSLCLSKSEGVFINSQLLHSAVFNSGKDTFSFTAIVFSPELIAPEYDHLYEKLILPIIKSELVLPTVLPRKAVDIIMETKDIFDLANPGYELAVKGNILRMLSICVEHAETRPYTKNSVRSEIIKKTLDYIHSNYENAVTLQDLSEHAHVSKEHLCRIFRSVSATTPIVYLNRYRITQSAYMLRNTGKTVSEISALCGFNNESYFDKMFMRFMNCTPSEYRRNVQ